MVLMSIDHVQKRQIIRSILNLFWSSVHISRIFSLSYDAFDRLKISKVEGFREVWFLTFLKDNFTLKIM